jgi:GWxTD domain-containing protein
MRDLSEDDRSWLAWVDAIILPEEANLFLSLPAGYSRDLFREDFWKRREKEGLPAPFGPGYRARYEHLREVAESDYEGLFGDAGRMVVRRGEPSAIQELKECSEVFRQAEIWSYPPDGSTGRDLHFLFYRPSFGAPRKLWLPGDTEIFQTASCIGSFDQACATTASGSPAQSPNVPCAGTRSVPRTCSAACYASRIAEEIRSRGSAAVAAAAAFAP